MQQPITHIKANPCAIDQWNPYQKRETFTPLLDVGTFNALVGRGIGPYTDPILFMHGCLDAPDEIPSGSTKSILTVGGFCREEYSRYPRETEDSKRWDAAGAEVGELLKKILEECDNS